MNVCTSKMKKIWDWRDPRFSKRVFGSLICADIAASTLVPEHDSIRFAGKYLLLGLAISFALKRAFTKKSAASAKWKHLAAAFVFWMLGFSALYLSQTLYGEANPIYQKIHDISYFVEMLIVMWIVLTPDLEAEDKENYYHIMVSLSILALVYMLALTLSGKYSIGRATAGQDLVELTFLNYSIFLMILTYSAKLCITHGRDDRVLYGSILACFVAAGIGAELSDSKLMTGLPKILLDIWVADAPVLAFLCVAVFEFDVAPWLEIPANNVIGKGVASSLILMTPITTGIMGIILWSSHPKFTIALVIGIVCMVIYGLQSFMSHIRPYELLQAAFDEKKLLRDVLHQDPVTGIYNRRWFDEALLLGCEDAKEGKPSIVIFMIDVDSFKGYNDTLGHRAGDYCLRAVAEALRSALGRDRDAVARYGGDEMAAILFQTNAEGAMAVAERMRQAVWDLNIKHPKNPHERVTVSIGIGIAGVTPGLITPSDLVLAADAALYESKARGKNAVTFRKTVPAPVDTATAMVMDKTLSVASVGMASSRPDS